MGGGRGWGGGQWRGAQGGAPDGGGLCLVRTVGLTAPLGRTGRRAGIQQAAGGGHNLLSGFRLPGELALDYRAFGTQARARLPDRHRPRARDPASRATAGPPGRRRAARGAPR